jgi:ribosome biogenesis protein Tsr3
VQSRLTKVLELAEAWRAVVLLDEADVFLAERDDENLSRNAITSISCAIWNTAKVSYC